MALLSHCRYSLLILLLFFAVQSFGTHIVGADISYRNIGANKFEFTLNVYRDCEGLPVNSYYNLDYSSLSCNLQGTFRVNMVAGSKQEITPVCEENPTRCNGGTLPGVEKYVYKGIFDVPQACTDWTISWRECYRNAAITNITSPITQCTYIEARLNNVDAPNNSSPAFTDDPVAFLGINQDNSINPKVSETDKDIVVYSITTPKTGKFSTIEYKPGFSTSNPLSSTSGFSIDPNSGALTVRPTAEEVSVTAIVASEYRNGVLVGSVMRDVQLVSRNFANAAPIISGINNSANTTAYVCPNTELCFSVYGSDLDKDQKLTMWWDKGIDTTKARFVVSGTDKSPRGNFCFQPALSDVGTHYFDVYLQDNHCPISPPTRKRFTVVVHEAPEVSLPASQPIACNAVVTLTATVTKGKSPYLYKWSTLESTPSVVKGPGSYSVTVTDANGCRGEASTSLISAVTADFENTKICYPDTVDFTDKSFSTSGTITSWSWDFGDPSSSSNTSTSQNPFHIYSKPGIYQVTLTVKDENGCEGKVNKVVKVCDNPVAYLKHQDSCQYKYLPFVDLSKATICGIKFYLITTDKGNYGGISRVPPFDFPFPPEVYFPGQPFYATSIIIPKDTGWTKYTLTIINENDCMDTYVDSVYVNLNPYGNVPEPSVYFKCNDPEVMFHVEDTLGKSPLKIQWSTGSTNDTIVVDKIGVYNVTIKDILGCDTSITRSVLPSLRADFSYSDYCKESDIVQFIDESFSHYGIVQWEWDFGDGNTSSLQNPVHNYANEGIYDVRLIVHCSVGCIDTITKKFFYILPDDAFSVAPTALCLGQEVKFRSPNVYNLDSLVWSFGNGDSLKIVKSQLYKNSNDSYYYEGKYVYPQGSAGNTYTVSLLMYYNDYRCSLNYAEDVRIYDELKIQWDSIVGSCAGLPTNIYASQLSGSPITSWTWEVYHFEHHHDHNHDHKVRVDSITLDPPVAFTFNNHGDYFPVLTVVNSDGCVLKDSTAHYVVKLPDPPDFCAEDTCALRDTRFFYTCSSFPEVSLEAHWDFGNGTKIISTEPFHKFDTAGVYMISLDLIASNFGCTTSVVKPVHIQPLPIPDFDHSNPCYGYPVIFTDKSESNSKNDSIYFWYWDFGDSTYSTEQHPVHLYSDVGEYEVVHYVMNKGSGCVDTIKKTITVRPNPEANFSVNEKLLTTLKPVKFIDESINGVKWLWYFGDGDSILITDPLSNNPEHIYNASVLETDVTQIVYSEYGCTDTITRHLDLKIYLILPTAFSPNGDGNNDELYLHYKGIDELLEFKVYNRWGEKVFDGENDLNARWDGTFRNAEQPLGTYVYYVKARTFHNEEIVLSGKLTLIR
ncbi:MAG TPA: PKD domain-containing protein [Cytophagaceae bacterium]